jgi:pyrroloquinoline quinone biosynthesis protein B
VRVRILGTAAGGGLPQWNCACLGCSNVRGTGNHRTGDCLAISGDGASWYLINASADLRSQIVAFAELAPPPGSRASPIAGVLLTSAELDHTIGLLSLREAARLAIWCTPTVRRALPFASTLDAYVRVDWRSVEVGVPNNLEGKLAVTAFAPGRKPPRYASGRDSPQWTVSYRIVDTRTGGVIVYAPGLSAWTPEFELGIQGADLVLLDGTFATTHEFASRDSQPMGHLSIEESLPHLRRLPGPRYVYTHLNNTNPLAIDGVDPMGLVSAGARTAVEGEVFVI